MCHSLTAPDGYDVTSVRTLLRVAFGKPGLTNSDCFQWNDSGCHGRIVETLPKKCGFSKTVKSLDTASFKLDTVLASVGGTNFKKEPKVVALRTTGRFAGADSAKFGGGFHYVMLIASGEDLKGKPFCVVFDADVSSTQAAIQAWRECTGGVNPEPDATPTQAMLDKMIFGAGGQLGPLIRYYYGT